MTDLCEKCGRNLNLLGQYRDFVHRTPDGPWCITLEEMYGLEAAIEVRAILEIIAEELSERLSRTLAEMYSA